MYPSTGWGITTGCARIRARRKTRSGRCAGGCRGLGIWESRFYRIETDCIYVVNVYNEREDFMMDLFGISGRTQESIDYWGK